MSGHGEETGVEVALTGRQGDFDLDIRFHAPAHGVTALFGPSGCGKTTSLRAAAGLSRLHGLVRVNGETWQDGRTFVPPHRRSVGYVFQEASLFPHLDVRGNLLFALRGHAPKTARARVHFDEAIDLLGLAPLMHRGTVALSGGERQRVAVARALVAEPQLLLMDEPLSALDQQTKQEVLPFLERLHASLAIPVFYVTHDMSEVEQLADQLVLMQTGRVIAQGGLYDLQSDPNLPLAGRRDASVSLDGRVTAYDPADGIISVDVPGGTILVSSGAQRPGASLRLRIGASEVSLVREPAIRSSILNTLTCRILDVRAAAPHQKLVFLALGADGSGARLLSRVTARSWRELELAPGMTTYAQIKSVALERRMAGAHSLVP